MPTRAEALALLTAPGQPHELVTVPGPRGPIRAFLNAPPTLREFYQTTRSDLPFLVYEDERLSFEDVWRQACALAHALVHDFHVAPGDRVAISMRNFPEWMIAFNAATAVGAIAVAMNAMWPAQEMEAGLATAGAKVLICDPERLALLARFNPPPRLLPPPAPELTVIAVRVASAEVPEGVHLWEAVLAAHAPKEEMPEPLAPFGPDDGP